MNVTLTHDLEQRLRSKVESGQFVSEEAVVKEALERFLADELPTQTSNSSIEAKAVEERLPGPFIEDDAMLPPTSLPRDSREIGSPELGNGTREKGPATRMAAGPGGAAA